MYTPKKHEPVRIGFYICHCGTNIAGMVDVKAVAKYVATLPNVVVSRDYKYMCSDPGQEMIVQDIIENRLNRIVEQLQLVEVTATAAGDDTLDLLERGEISADEAAARLRR